VRWSRARSARDLFPALDESASHCSCSAILSILHVSSVKSRPIIEENADLSTHQHLHRMPPRAGRYRQLGVGGAKKHLRLPAEAQRQ
jgi:hypothetical protein